MLPMPLLVPCELLSGYVPSSSAVRMAVRAFSARISIRGTEIETSPDDQLKGQTCPRTAEAQAAALALALAIEADSVVAVDAAAAVAAHKVCVCALTLWQGLDTR